MSAWRLHTHFEVERGVPVRIDVTGASNRGENDERAVLRTTLSADRCYVLDRGLPSSPCSMTSSPPKAATSAASATTVPMRSSKGVRCPLKPRRPT
jgi:hypothetical protein